MPHYTFWHLHRNKKSGPDEPIGIMVLGKDCEECRHKKEVMPSGTRDEMPASTRNTAVTGEHRAITSAELEVLKKKFLESKLGKSAAQSIAFIKIAMDNGGVVTYAQAAEINPKYPTDPANYCRQKGWEVITDRKNKLFKVGDYGRST